MVNMAIKMHIVWHPPTPTDAYIWSMLRSSLNEKDNDDDDDAMHDGDDENVGDD